MKILQSMVKLFPAICYRLLGFREEVNLHDHSLYVASQTGIFSKYRPSERQLSPLLATKSSPVHNTNQ